MGSVSFEEIISVLVILGIQVAFVGGVVYGVIHLYRRLNGAQK